MLRENQASAAATVTARIATTPVSAHTTPAMAVSLRPWRAQRRSVVGAARAEGDGTIHRGVPAGPALVRGAAPGRGGTAWRARGIAARPGTVKPPVPST